MIKEERQERGAGMICRALPYYEFEQGVYEIDEFDCASIFVIVGEQRALVLDTGVGIGDLRYVIERRITDKPYDVVITHNHGDHTGGAGFFDEVWVHEKDKEWNDPETGPSTEFRKSYARLIAGRENKNYRYDIERDIRPWPGVPVKRSLKDGQVFDLGGRRVTIYHCPGHTAGECAAIDDKSRILFIGDACNRNLLLHCEEGEDAMQAAERAGAALCRIGKLHAQYDSIYNSHHDYRGLGSPLAPDVLPDAILCLQAMAVGKEQTKEVPDALSAEHGRKRVAWHGCVEVSCIGGNV